jgi:hypothetical protein
MLPERQVKAGQTQNKVIGKKRNFKCSGNIIFGRLAGRFNIVPQPIGMENDHLVKQTAFSAIFSRFMIMMTLAITVFGRVATIAVHHFKTNYIAMVVMGNDSMCQQHKAGEGGK